MRNLPAVILAYLGQGARLITDGADILPSIFYLSIPGPTSGGLYWITFVMAILATVIASQVKLSPVLIYTRSATRAQLTLCAPGDDLRLLQPDPTAHLMEGELTIMIARLERVDVDFSFPIVLPAPQSRSHERSRGRSNIQ